MKRSYADMLQVIRDQVAQHNEVMGEESEGRLDAELIIKQLKIAGYTTVEGLVGCSWERLQSCGLLEGLAKAVTSVWRERDTGPAKSQPGVVRVLSMTDEQLLEVYDPNTPNAPVSRQLGTRSREKPCIAFNHDGSVNVSVSALALKAIARKQGRAHVSHSGVLHELFCVGVNPSEIAYVHPLIKGKVLGVDGSDEFGFEWGVLEEQVLQFLALAVEVGEIKVKDRSGMQAIYREASAPDGLAALGRVYMKTRLEFDRRLRINGLPCIRTVLSGSVVADPITDDDVLSAVLGEGDGDSRRTRKAS